MTCLAPDYGIHPGLWNPFPLLHYAFEASGPLAAKAAVFNSNYVADVASSIPMEPNFTEDGFYNDFFKMLGYFYGDNLGLEGASRLCVLVGTRQEHAANFEAV